MYEGQQPEEAAVLFSLHSLYPEDGLPFDVSSYLAER